MALHIQRHRSQEVVEDPLWDLQARSLSYQWEGGEAALDFAVALWRCYASNSAAFPAGWDSYQCPEPADLSVKRSVEGSVRLRCR